MKTSITHLPEQKQTELRRALEIVLDHCEPDLIILFGSYARGDWQEQKTPDGAQFQFQSDFDLLLVVRTEQQARQIERLDVLRSQLSQEIETPVSLVAEDLAHINQQLANARYFYVDIVREGIVLHDNGRAQLGEVRELPLEQRRALAQEDLDHWLEKSRRMLRTCELCVMDDNNHDAAFMLHQATERAYAAISLVYTHYKPRTHDLARLGERISSIEPRFSGIFPLQTEDDQRRFELLRRAYVDARYTKNYVVSREDLEWLSQRIQLLQDMAARLCQERIASYV